MGFSLVVGAWSIYFADISSSSSSSSSVTFSLLQTSLSFSGSYSNSNSNSLLLPFDSYHLYPPSSCWPSSFPSCYYRLFGHLTSFPNIKSPCYPGYSTNSTNAASTSASTSSCWSASSLLPNKHFADSHNLLFTHLFLPIRLFQQMAPQTRSVTRRTNRPSIEASPSPNLLAPTSASYAAAASAAPRPCTTTSCAATRAGPWACRRLWIRAAGIQEM